MRWTMAHVPPLEHRVAVVTGATSGLGLATTRALASAGATVVMATRNPAKTTRVITQLRTEVPAADLVRVPLDLADLVSVDAAASHLADRFERIDLLVNNAGVMNTPLRRTADGFEWQFGINHLGHFAFTAGILGLLADAADPRIVTVSSLMARTGTLRFDDPNWERDPYQPWPAYGQSKLANQSFAVELHRRLRAAGSPIASLAAHPGWTHTDLQTAGPRMRGGLRARLVSPVMGLANRVLAQDVKQGVLPQLYAATAPTAVSGHYYGPDGRFGLRGEPTEIPLLPAAKAEDQARRLWELSERLTGATWDLGHGSAK